MTLKKILITIFVLMLGTSLQAFYDATPTHFSNGFPIPNTMPDAVSETFGIDNALTESAYNMFFNAAQVMNSETVYMEAYIPQGVATNTILLPDEGRPLLNPYTKGWLGATLNVSSLKFAIFLGRPYSGYAKNYLTTPLRLGIAGAGTISGLGGTFNAYVGNQLLITGHAANAIQIAMPLIPVNQVDVIGGTKLGNMALGIKFSFADNAQGETYEYNSTPVVLANDGKVDLQKSVSDHHLTLGLLLNDFIFMKSLDIAVDLGLMSLANTYLEKRTLDNALVDINVASDNSPSIGIILRPIMKLGDGVLIMPVNFNIIDNSSISTWKEDLNGDGIFTALGEYNAELTLKDKTTIIGVNTAYHSQPVEKLKVIYSLGFNVFSRTITASGTDKNTGFIPALEESKESTVTLPIALAFEHKTFSWMSTRLSATKNIELSRKLTASDQAYAAGVLTSTTTDELKNPYTGAGVMINGGLGIKPMDKMQIDLVLAVGLIKMPDFDENVVPIPLISRISVQYHF